MCWWLAKNPCTHLLVLVVALVLQSYRRSYWVGITCLILCLAWNELSENSLWLSSGDSRLKLSLSKEPFKHLVSSGMFWWKATCPEVRCFSEWKVAHRLFNSTGLPSWSLGSFHYGRFSCLWFLPVTSWTTPWNLKLSTPELTASGAVLIHPREGKISNWPSWDRILELYFSYRIGSSKIKPLLHSILFLFSD